MPSDDQLTRDSTVRISHDREFDSSREVVWSTEERVFIRDKNARTSEAMKDRDRERKEFEPVGEGSTIPDGYDVIATNDGGYDRSDDSITTSNAGYPDERDENSPAHECHSCCALIPSDRTRCNFCLVNQIDPDDAAEPLAGERTLTGIIHAIIIAETKMDAITKATAAFSTLTVDPSTTDGLGIDEYELLANSAGETVRQLAREWGQLPDAAALESLEGQRLLDTVRQNAIWNSASGEEPIDERTDSEERGEQELDPVVFNGDGEPITEHSELAELFEHGSLDRMSASQSRHRMSDTSEQLTWIVPALALQDVDPEEDQPETGRYDRPTRRLLSCLECDSETEHVFSGSQELPDPAWSGDPIWECTRCETPRFGPDPATVGDRSGEANGS